LEGADCSAKEVESLLVVTLTWAASLPFADDTEDSTNVLELLCLSIDSFIRRASLARELCLIFLLVIPKEDIIGT
jgi:hypothetical protein